jgi:hypothetical protein
MPEEISELQELTADENEELSPPNNTPHSATSIVCQFS